MSAPPFFSGQAYDKQLWKYRLNHSFHLTKVPKGKAIDWSNLSSSGPWAVLRLDLVELLCQIAEGSSHWFQLRPIALGLRSKEIEDMAVSFKHLTMRNHHASNIFIEQKKYQVALYYKLTPSSLKSACVF